MTAERDWEESLNEIIAGLQDTTARCRCGVRIHLLGGQWQDENGLTTCGKAAPRQDPQPGEPVYEDLVLHAPALAGQRDRRQEMYTSNGYVLVDGRKVYGCRQRMRLRQADVTTKLAALGLTSGFSQARVSRIETGQDGGTARWVTPWEATALAAVLGQPVWAILAKDPDEDPRIAEARDLAAKLAEALAPRSLVPAAEPPAEPENITLKLLMADDA